MTQPTPTAPVPGPFATTLWPRVAVALLLLIHAALAIDTLRQKSVTVDEVGHLPAGISYWQKGTFELYHHNPPLVKLLAALPALAAGPAVDYSKSWDVNLQLGMPLNQWAFGWEFMYANAARFHDIYFWARLPVVGLSVLAGFVIFAWAKELFGPVAGLVALGLWTFCPNAIAHAGMVTTDMGATSIGFVATYLFWRYLRRPTYLNAAMAGAVLGLAELTKFSSLLFYMIWPALWIVSRLLRTKIASGQRKGNANREASSKRLPGESAELAGSSSSMRGLMHLAAIGLISVIVINLGYRFEGTCTRLKEFTFLSKLLTRPRQPADGPPMVPREHPWYSILMARQNRFVGTWLANLPVPLPRHFVEGFDEQKLESEGIDGSGYPVYLCGELRRTGWWWYYVFALLVKVPLGTWALTIAALIAAVRRPAARSTMAAELVLLVPIGVVLFVMSFLTDINLGLRYVLPMFPFWFVLLSRLGQGVADRAPAWVAVVGLSLAWNVVACARIHPHHLAYFNESVGGAERGSLYLIDSNLDWGQDMLTVESWVRENRPGEKVGLAYFGNVDPSILAASGRPLRFELAPPARLDKLRLVATKPGGPFFGLRRQWVETHFADLQIWLTTEHANRREVQPNDHPDLRALFFEQLGLHEGPQPGLFAVSANMVCGLPFRVRDQAGNIWSAEQDAYSYFRKLTPVARVGYSIFVYDVSLERANALRAEMGLSPLQAGGVE